MELLSPFSGMWCSVTEYLIPTILKESGFIFKGLDAAPYLRKMKSSIDTFVSNSRPKCCIFCFKLKRIATSGMRKSYFE